MFYVMLFSCLSIAAHVFECYGLDLIMAEAALLYLIFYLYAKSEKK